MPPEIDQITEVPCAHCHQPVRLTWTRSAENHSVLHSQCWTDRHQTERTT